MSCKSPSHSRRKSLTSTRAAISTRHGPLAIHIRKTGEEQPAIREGEDRCDCPHDPPSLPDSYSWRRTEQGVTSHFQKQIRIPLHRVFALVFGFDPAGALVTSRTPQLVRHSLAIAYVIGRTSSEPVRFPKSNVLTLPFNQRSK